MTENHLQELLFAVMKQRDAFRQETFDIKNKFNESVLQAERQKIQIDNLKEKIKTLENDKLDLVALNDMLEKMLCKMSAKNR